MAVEVENKKSTKPRDYDDIRISLENCILPPEKVDETPSMKDGLDRDFENELRIFGCELIQTAGILLKLPQVAMATGQVLLQRFYYSKSMVKHEVDVLAMSAIFLAAKIEESPRRLRSVINVCHHIKLKMTQKPEAPMDYFSQAYFNLKNAIIKAERRILKELGFCVHVKHPHKIIITYLQILDSQTNRALARMSWNYMNDSLQTDIFIRFPPEKIACACISLSARKLKINLPMRPPWWTLFGADQDEIDLISIAILRLYARPRRNLAKLEAIIAKAKKRLQAQKAAAAPVAPSGGFTPSHIATSGGTGSAQNTSSSQPRPNSKTNSPQEKQTNGSKVSNEKERDRTRDRNNGRSRMKRSASRSPVRSAKQPPHKQRRSRSVSADYTSDSDAPGSDSSTERPSRKYAQQKADYDKVQSNSGPGHHRTTTAPARSSNAAAGNNKEGNGAAKTVRDAAKPRRRSRSPIRRARSISPAPRKERGRHDSKPVKLKRPDKGGRR